MFISSQCGCWFQSGAQLLSPSAPLWFGDPRADFLLDRNDNTMRKDCEECEYYIVCKNCSHLKLQSEEMIPCKRYNGVYIL